jgi:hypothetical protein
MKHLNINTEKKINDSTVNNGCRFPESTNITNSYNCSLANFSGSTNLHYHSTSTGCHESQIRYQSEKDLIMYSICVDWIEFICTWDEPIEIAFINNNKPSIVIQKVSVHRNPNFRNLHKVYCNGVEAVEIYSFANNTSHAKNEVSVKVANVRLYEDKYYELVCYILDLFGLTFVRYARVDIALDGAHIFKIEDLLNKWFKSHTIQTNNKAIKILPTSFNKRELKCNGWSIGEANSGISARIYNKSKEIADSKKDYVSDFWKANGIVTGSVGRFEVQLNYKRLKKYNLALDDMKQFMDAEFLGAIFETEVRPWLKLYRVKKKDFLSHKKEIAIQKGKEIKFIDWDRLASKMELISIVNHVSNSARINARNTISFNLNEILLHPDTSTTAQVDIIQKYASDYDLNQYVISKINSLFGNPIKDQYFQILKPLITPARDQ